MGFVNVYEDAERAKAYAALEFPGTYYLAYRDLPQIIRAHVKGSKALDFGCGAGRSTRFVKSLGFDAVGIDISEDMLTLARERDPQGDYRLAGVGGLRELGPAAYDLVISVFTFDNIPLLETKVALFRGLKDLLGPEGRIISLVSAPEIYTHDWASFKTSCFPGNKTARRGDSVYTIMNDVVDRRPVHDILWPDEAYRETYELAGLEVVEVYRPLGRTEDSCEYVNEMTVAPWVIYVLCKAN
ncbi:MAG TPA: class I SAM-dependent methyltransferase [bacterium]